MNKPMFSVHDYDEDGDEMERGIYLHFGDTRIKAAKTFKEFKEVVAEINKMVGEISERYLDA